MKAAGGLVYFIQQDVTNAIKIGYTANLPSLARRLRSLQLASAYALRLLCRTPGTPSLERELHRQFRAHRLRGEWFSPCAAIAQAIADITEKGNQPTAAALAVAPLARQLRLRRQRRPAGVLEKKGRWYYRPTSMLERAARAAQGLPETIPLGAADTAEARKKWATLRDLEPATGANGNQPAESATYAKNL